MFADWIKIKLNFIAEPAFQSFIGCTVAMNIFMLWLETDYADWPYWETIDAIFLIIFMCEIVARVLHVGLRVFASGPDRYWNLFDAAIVVLGVLDLWIFPCVLHWEDGGSPGPPLSLRFIRLLRIVRIVRLFHIFWDEEDKVEVHIEAINRMLKSVFLLFAILLLINGILAIVCTQVFGQGMGGHIDHLDPEKLSLLHFHFKDVPTSFLSLFSIVTRDNWYNIVAPLDVWWKLFFIGYIIITWTLISILTALATNHTISLIHDREEKEFLEKERRQKEFIDFLNEAFQSADEDGNGFLEKEEFDRYLDTGSLKQIMASFGMEKRELQEIWMMLDTKKSGKLVSQEFVNGLAWLKEGLCTRHIATLRYGIKRFKKCADEKLLGLETKILDSRRKNDMLLQSLRKQEQVHRQQCLALKLWQQWAVAGAPDVVTAEVQQVVANPISFPVCCSRAGGPFANSNPSAESERRNGKDALESVRFASTGFAVCVNGEGMEP